MSMIEFVNQAAAIDVESLEDIEDLLNGDFPVEGPQNHIEVFLAGLEAIQDAVQEELTILKPMLEQPKIAPVQFHPEALALQMFQPALPEITIPVLMHPAADGYL